MERLTKDEIIIRHYLLDGLSQAEQEQVEQKLMTDDTSFHLAFVLEEELIDQYLFDSLSSDERERFSRRFLSTPEGAEQLKLAASLKRYARNNKIGATLPSPVTETTGMIPQTRPRFSTARFAFAATAVIFTTILILLALRAWRLQDEVESRQESPTLREQELQNQISEQQARNDALAISLQQEQELRAKLEREMINLSGSKPDRPQPLIAAITLPPGRFRGGTGGSRLVVKSGMSQVMLHLLVRQPAYASYQASLQNAPGEQIWMSGSLKPQTEQRRIAIRVNISSQLLSGGDYRLRLQGRADNGDYEDAGNYYFRVTKQ